MTVYVLSTGPQHCPWFEDYLGRIHRWPLRSHVLSPKLTPKAYEDAITPKLKGYRIFLDERGTMMDSVTFAAFCEKTIMDNHDCTFLVGPSFGIPATLSWAKRISLSPMTFPHEMARILLAEQLYRAQQILMGHAYHQV